MFEIHRYLKNKIIMFDKLISFGFSEQDGVYEYTTTILNGQFKFCVKISSDSDISFNVTDSDTNEEYTPIHISGASGAFLGDVASACSSVLDEIADKCFAPDVFKTPVAKMIIEHIYDKYAVSPEFLWDNFDAAVFRHYDNNKWFAIIMKVKKKSIGLVGDDVVEIIDLKMDFSNPTLPDFVRYFPGYHMNKKHWYTIMLDDFEDLNSLKAQIEQSYVRTK